MYVESLDHYLEVFVNVLDNPDTFLPHGLLIEPSIKAFDSYLKSKLTAPRGWRHVQREDGEIYELDVDDREAFSDQLRSIGCIARTIPHHSFPLLTQSISQSIESCLQCLEMFRRDPGSLYTQHNTLDSMYEDLHWLVLIAGFMLCDIVKGIYIHIWRTYE